MNILGNANAKMNLVEGLVTSVKKTIGEIQRLVIANHVIVIRRDQSLFNVTGQLENAIVWMVSIYRTLPQSMMLFLKMAYILIRRYRKYRFNEFSQYFRIIRIS